jgi:hypothetical protein
MAAEVTVKAEPQASYEQAGLIWHADDANYVKVMLERFEGKLVVNFVREEADQPKIVAMAPTEAARSHSSHRAWRQIRGAEPKAEAKEWVTIGTAIPCPSRRFRSDSGPCRGPRKRSVGSALPTSKITQPAEAGAE